MSSESVGQISLVSLDPKIWASTKLPAHPSLLSLISYLAERLTSIKNHLATHNMSERIVLPSEGAHGERNGTATATCYCGAVQIEVPSEGEGLIDTFICHCTDCRKITAR